jgi:acetyl/propionyl-CoA carboxylase alpha subunit
MFFDATVGGRGVRVEVRVGGGVYTVILDGRPLEVDLEETGSDFFSLLLGGRSYEVGLERRPGGYVVVLEDDVILVEIVDAGRGLAAPKAATSGQVRLVAPMPGKIVRILVDLGQAVAQGQGIAVIEAMKMENEIRSPRGGCVRELPLKEGQTVDTGTLLAVVE